MKILINREHGGPFLSRAACLELGLPWDEAKAARLGGGAPELRNKALGIDSPDPHAYRCDPRVIAMAEKLGPAANGPHTELLIVEIPDGVEWEIWSYDGKESVHEKHRFWPAERDFPA